MQKKKNNRKMQLPISIVLLCLTGAICGGITWLSGVDFIFYLLLIPSVFLTVQLVSTFHEFGHYLALKNGGFEVYYFKCSNFTIDKYGKKIKISLFGEHLGELRFYPKEQVEYSKILKKSLWSGILASCIIAVLLNVVLCLAFFGVFGSFVGPYLSLIFSFSPYAFYVLIINAIPWFHPENDASRICKINKDLNYKRTIDKVYSIQKALFEGKTYAEIPNEYFTFEQTDLNEMEIALAVYSLRRAIENEEWGVADELSRRFENVNELDEEIRCELLYKAIVNGEEGVLKHLDVLKRDLDDSKPYVLRVMLANAKRLNDEQFFNALKPTAIKVCDNEKFCKGDVLYNKKLIEKL